VGVMLESRHGTARRETPQLGGTIGLHRRSRLRFAVTPANTLAAGPYVLQVVGPPAGEADQPGATNSNPSKKRATAARSRNTAREEAFWYLSWTFATTSAGGPSRLLPAGSYRTGNFLPVR
jgi:hypothetical protein